MNREITMEEVFFTGFQRAWLKFQQLQGDPDPTTGGEYFKARSESWLEYVKTFTENHVKDI